ASTISFRADQRCRSPRRRLDSAPAGPDRRDGSHRRWLHRGAGRPVSPQNAPFIAQESIFPPEPALSWWEQLTAMESYVRYALGSLLLFFLIIFGIRPLVKHLTRRNEPVSLTPVQDEEQTLAAMLENTT